MLRSLLGGLLLAASTLARAGNEDPRTAEFLRRAQCERVAISPDGNALAIAYRQEGGAGRGQACGYAGAQVDPGNRGEVSALHVRIGW